jgi:hypothetical protein
MLIPPPAWDVLLDAGLSVAPLNDHTIEVVGDGSAGEPVRLLFEVKSYSGPVTPEAVRRIRSAVPDGLLLLVLPSASDAVRAEVHQAGWSMIALNAESALGPDGFLRTRDDDTIVLPVRGPDRPPARRRRRGPVAFGAASVIRHLLQSPGLKQTEMARRAGVSQARVSQVFADLSERGLLHRTLADGRWQVDDWDGLLDHWLAEYPGPHGITTYWYGLDAVTAQASRVLEFLAQSPPRHIFADSTRGFGRLSQWRPPVVSGDVAVDRLVPWHRPVRAVIYASEGRDLSTVGLTPAGTTEATFELVVPADPGIWNRPAGSPPEKTEPAEGATWRLADRVQILWDLLQSPAPDSNQAADRYRSFLRQAYRDAEASSDVR